MRYCAFLRGVNVKGTTMKMAEACTVLENAGMEEVQSVLATGNLIFSSEIPAKNLKPLLERALSDYFDFEVFLFLKNEQEIRKMLENCPFSADPGKHNYIFIAEEGFENQLLESFRNCQTEEGERAEINHGTFYWQVPKGNTLGSEFGKILGKKSFKSQFTSRNINTFEKIIKKL